MSKVLHLILSFVFTCSALFCCAPAMAQDLPPIDGSDPYQLYTERQRTPYWDYRSGSPLGDALRGVAAVTEANAAYQSELQRARKLRVEVTTAKLEARRKAVEQWRWERQTRFEMIEEEKERAKRLEVKHHLDAPSTAVWSGKALNVLLKDIQRTQRGSGALAGSAALDKIALKKINVTSGLGGHLGMFRSNRLPWPILLRREEFDEPRKQLDILTDRAVTEALTQDIKLETILEMERLCKAIDARLTKLMSGRQNTEVWTPSLCIDSMRFLKELRAGILMLQRPEAADFIKGRYAAEGDTVAELVQHMTNNGLRFAPATPGNEKEYSMLYHHLASYHQKLHN